MKQDDDYVWVTEKIDFITVQNYNFSSRRYMVLKEMGI